MKIIGHPIDKVELLVLGGTWESYPEEYREEFIRDIFYAANVFFDINKREKYNLEEEQIINETAKVKIIGLTLETRPDTINEESIKLFRKYGCTRIQLGIQHLDDNILKKVNRGHSKKDAEFAMKLLKDSCYKVDIHLMPDLPGSSPEKDNIMFDQFLNHKKIISKNMIVDFMNLKWNMIKFKQINGKFILVLLHLGQ